MTTLAGRALAARIKRRLEELRWKASDLERRSGVDKSYVSKILAGRTKRLGSDVRDRLELALGVSLQDHVAALSTGPDVTTARASAVLLVMLYARDHHKNPTMVQVEQIANRVAGYVARQFEELS